MAHSCSRESTTTRGKWWSVGDWLRQ